MRRAFHWVKLFVRQQLLASEKCKINLSVLCFYYLDIYIYVYLADYKKQANIYTNNKIINERQVTNYEDNRTLAVQVHRYLNR